MTLNGALLVRLPSWSGLPGSRRGQLRMDWTRRRPWRVDPHTLTTTRVLGSAEAGIRCDGRKLRWSRHRRRCRRDLLRSRDGGATFQAIESMATTPRAMAASTTGAVFFIDGPHLRGVLPDQHNREHGHRQPVGRGVLRRSGGGAGPGRVHALLTGRGRTSHRTGVCRAYRRLPAGVHGDSLLMFAYGDDDLWSSADGGRHGRPGPTFSRCDQRWWPRPIWHLDRYTRGLLRLPLSSPPITAGRDLGAPAGGDPNRRAGRARRNLAPILMSRFARGHGRLAVVVRALPVRPVIRGRAGRLATRLRALVELPSARWTS